MFKPGIVVTRPREQAASLMQRLSALAVRPILFPCLEIKPIQPNGLLEQTIAAWSTFDTILFISPNAAKLVAPHVSHLSSQPQIAAVGTGTAAALAQYGMSVTIMPEQSFTTEGLLALTAFQHIEGKRIAIMKGEGGRELLVNTLRQRKAEVIEVPVYQRCCPRIDPAPLLQQLQRGAVHIILVTSGEALHNFNKLLGEAGRVYWQSTPLLVSSERLAQLAYTLGATHVYQAVNASDDALVQAIVQWKSLLLETIHDRK